MMTAVIVVLSVLAVLFLLGQLRIGARAEYEESGFSLRIKAGPLWFQVFPPKEKADSGKKKKKEKKEQKEKPQSKRGGSLALLKKLLPLAAQAAGELRRKVRVDMLWLEFTAGGEEAAQTALSFGYVNSAIGMIWPLLDHNLNIKDHCIRTRADFQRAAPAVYLRLEATLTLGQALVLAIKLLARFSAIYGAYRREQAPADNTKKEAV